MRCASYHELRRESRKLRRTRKISESLVFSFRVILHKYGLGVFRQHLVLGKPNATVGVISQSKWANETTIETIHSGIRQPRRSLRRKKIALRHVGKCCGKAKNLQYIQYQSSVLASTSFASTRSPGTTNNVASRS